MEQKLPQLQIKAFNNFNLQLPILDDKNGESKSKYFLFDCSIPFIVHVFFSYTKNVYCVANQICISPLLKYQLQLIHLITKYIII